MPGSTNFTKKGGLLQISINAGRPKSYALSSVSEYSFDDDGKLSMDIETKSGVRSLSVTLTALRIEGVEQADADAAQAAMDALFPDAATPAIPTDLPTYTDANAAAADGLEEGDYYIESAINPAGTESRPVVRLINIAEA